MPDTLLTALYEVFYLILNVLNDAGTLSPRKDQLH